MAKQQQQERHARDKASWEQRHAEALQTSQESVQVIQVHTLVCIFASLLVQVPEARHLVISSNCSCSVCGTAFWWPNHEAVDSQSLGLMGV